MLQDATIQTQEKRPSILDRPLSTLVQVNWESLAWTLLIVVTVVSRFYNLGVRAMSHDESLHALYSFYLYDKGEYIHDPMMHGPLLFHFDALAYFLFGVSDATARLFPALAGIGAVLMALPFRRYLGRMGALMAGLLICISPSLLFHSRYIRNDIYIVLFSMIWVYGLFRYLESRERRWLYMVVTGMALGFISKENHFINGALFGAFFAGLAFWRLWQHRESLFESSIADLAVLMLTLVLPFTTPFLHEVLGWDPMAKASTQDFLRSAGLVAVTTSLSVGIAMIWYGKWLRGPDRRPTFSLLDWTGLMIFFWVIQILFFTTFLTNSRDGLATGIVGSMGYWLEQQDVKRGSQPWYYYILQGGLYEFLPMILTAGGLATLVRWAIRPQWDPTLAVDLPVRSDGPQATPEARPTGYLEPVALRRYMIFFLFWWVMGSWAGYSYAGERMPWLLTHIALPMILFGGWWLGRLIQQIDWRKVSSLKALWLAGAAPALIFLLAVMLRAMPFQGRSLPALTSTVQWMLALLLFVALAYVAARRVLDTGWAVAGRLMAVGLMTLLFLLTVRVSFMLTYINFDYVNEYLVYAHASPDIKRALAEIDLVSERTVGGRDIVVAYDDDSSWPLSWYMRDYPNAKYYVAPPGPDITSAPIVIVGPKNYEAIRPYMARDYVKRTYRLVWWPEESYKGEWDAEKGQSRGLTFTQIWNNLRDPEARSRLWQIFFYRRHPGLSLTAWPHRHEFEMYVQKDLAAQVWDLGVTPVVQATDTAAALAQEREVDLFAQTIYSEAYEGLALNRPRAVAVGPDGLRVVADANNHRILVLNPDGSLVRTFGSLCRLSEGAQSGCVDPDGAGPLAIGDGQFNEPWGVAVDDQGRIYVSDTWNGRIQVFDSEGKFQTKWGAFAILAPDALDPSALFGPRGLAIDTQGNLLVADTGNKRIIRYTAEGEYVDQIGGGGVILGRFEEPVSVAVDPRDGAIFVADTWNRRIQKLSSNLEPIGEWPVPGWESEAIFDKPYLTVDGRGNIYASDPEYYRIVVFGPGGEIKAAFGRYGQDSNTLALPNGVAYDPGADIVLVADADNNRVMAFPTMP